MKNFCLLFFIIALVSSCEDGKKETLKDNKEVATSEAQEIETMVSSTKVPVYDFDQLSPLLERENDTTYVINFWATWCKPCIKELPYFEEVNANYSEEKVKVILVSLDFPTKLESQVIPFIEDRNILSHVVLLDDPDANSWISKVDSTWSGAIPATVIYKNDKRKFYERSFTLNELETELKTFL